VRQQRSKLRELGDPRQLELRDPHKLKNLIIVVEQQKKNCVPNPLLFGAKWRFSLFYGVLGWKNINNYILMKI
jgi:hypothetical protein